MDLTTAHRKTGGLVGPMPVPELYPLQHTVQTNQIAEQGLRHMTYILWLPIANEDVIIVALTDFLVLILVFLFGDEVLNGNCSVGQLTTIGYNQQLANGKALRQAYVEKGFLGSKISLSEIYIRSDSKRLQ